LDVLAESRRVQPGVLLRTPDGSSLVFVAIDGVGIVGIGVDSGFDDVVSREMSTERWSDVGIASQLLIFVF